MNMGAIKLICVTIIFVFCISHKPSYFQPHAASFAHPSIPLFLPPKHHRFPSHDPPPLLPVLASVLFVHLPLLPPFHGAASPYHRGGTKRGGGEEAKGGRREDGASRREGAGRGGGRTWDDW